MHFLFLVDFKVQTSLLLVWFTWWPVGYFRWCYCNSLFITL